MSNISSKDPIKAVSQFDIKGNLISCNVYGNGHINATFLAEYEEEGGQMRRYIVQALNQNAFKQPEQVISNIQKVTSFLSKNNSDERRVMSMIPTVDGEYFFRDEDGDFWRVYTFVENSLCIERPDNAEDFKECAVAFGHFQRDLNDFPAAELYETIPDFHNTPKRYENFLKAVEEDCCSRAAGVAKEIEFVKARADFYATLYKAHEQGKLPLRVTHNDTKSNNVLLDADSHEALCVIDLDTIMPGFSVTDFGDAIRFGANTAAEDEKDLSKVLFDVELYDAYAEGFISGCDGLMSEDEIMLLPEGSKMMTVECGMRFLTDYLCGDTYFKTAYPEHNLDRCRTQFKLVEEMEKNWDTMKSIVKKYI